MPHSGQASGDALGIAAMITLDLSAKPMLDQPAQTLRALEAMAADTAERQRRMTPAIEEEQRLLFLLDGALDAAQQDGRQEAAPRRRMAAHVHGWRSGSAAVTVARRQVQQLVTPDVAQVLPAFRDGVADQNGREIADAGAHHRHVARIIEDAIFLLVSGIVLLIDDDEAEIFERQEQRRARARRATRTSPVVTCRQTRSRMRRARSNAIRPALRRNDP